MNEDSRPLQPPPAQPSPASPPRPVLPDTATPAPRRTAGPGAATSAAPAPRRPSASPTSPARPTPAAAARPSRWRKRSAAELPAGPRRAADPVPGGRGLDIPRGWVFTIIALLLVLAVLLTALAILTRGGRAAGTPSPATPQLVTSPDDARAMLGQWEQTTTPAAANGSPIACATPGLAGLPPSTSDLSRDLQSDNRHIRHVLSSYADIGQAQEVYRTRLSQFGTCDVEHGWLLTEAGRVDNLGQEAFYVVATTQDAFPVEHVLIAVRADRYVDLFDVASPAGATRQQQIAVASGPVARQCQAASVRCGVGPVLSPAPFPTGPAPGFLAPADVPLVTPGVGHWIASAIATSVRTRGTLCETNLNAPPGAVKQSQRSLILAADPQAPASFGIDNVVLSFADPGAAARYADDLRKQLTTCSERINTAKVDPPQALNTRVADLTVTGSTFRIVQNGDGKSLPYRAAIATAGSTVVYAVLTPTPTYTLSGDAWAQVATRAAARAAELT